METRTGKVKNVVFRNPENGYTVLEMVDDDGRTFTAVGTVPLANAGEKLSIEGEWTEHKTYGRQLRAERVETLAPSSLTELENYLGSGLFEGIGEVTARAIVAMFGMESLEVIEHEPDRLREVPGIGPVRAGKIARSFDSQKELRDVMLALRDFGITVNQGIKLYKAYGSLCLAKLRENPYRIIDDIEGIGFITADKLARNSGIEADSPFRIQAGIKYTLQWARQEGHTFLPREKLVSVASELLQTELGPTEDALDALIINVELAEKHVAGEDAVFLPAMLRAESECARRLTELSAGAYPIFQDTKGRIAELESQFGIELAPQQKRAVMLALSKGALVITGGPGTGKTTILRFIIRLFERAGMSFELCAPTGRAAKRMSEASGAEASTIHRLLGYGFGSEGFVRDEDNPLETDAVIADEMSMVDVALMRALLRATPRGTRLIMVGDADQLPSVGPGNVLRDIISSGMLPVVRLDEIFRQSERGMIVENAHRINAGKMPSLDSGEDDFRFEETASFEAIIRRVLALYSGKTNKLMTNDPIKDVQVIAPMKRGDLGINNLNARLQQSLNPPSRERRELKRQDGVMREGDKVMQIKNNYKIEWTRPLGGEESGGMGVFNGDLGTIMKIDLEDRSVRVLFDDERLAVYDFIMLDELTLAYAVTIHKSQGSEFPIVIMPLAGGPPQLLTRNLLYTAVTRAREQVYIVGRERTIETMVANEDTKRRYSALSDFMKEYGSAGGETA